MIKIRWPITAMLIALMLATNFWLVACGVKSSPNYPEDSSYPRQYPSATKSLKTKSRPEKSTNDSHSGNIYLYPNTVPIR